MKRKISLLLMAVFCSFSLNAQTVDDIIDSYFENTGGKEAWKELKTMKMEGKMSMGPMELPGTIVMATPNLQRMEFDVQGKTVVQAYDGTVAWMINPFMGGEDAQRMPEEEAEEMIKEKFEDDFLDYKDKGHKAELLGKKEIEGAETFEVKLTKKDGDVEYHYFDTEYFVPIMTKTIMTTGEQKGQAIETYLSDYQEVDNFMMPFFMESKLNGETMQKITIISIELDAELEEGYFDFPGMSEGEAAEKETGEAPGTPEEKMEKMKEIKKETPKPVKKEGGN